VGTPEQVASELEMYWRETGCHGFNITPTVTPASVDDFVDEVVPILQRRGVFRTEYQGTTLRDHLFA
jgi:alkanesulfonate monooxygenase SsuD/methylene tetrahydromethanopterin reductase-like flavin-dependent oxidoreductase (luciferase family)